MQGTQRHGQEHGRTIGIRHNEAARTPIAALYRDQAQMVMVQLRDDQRHVRIHAMVFGIAQHDTACSGKAVFDFARYRRIETRECDAAVQVRRARPDFENPHGFGNRRVLLPCNHFFVAPAH